MVMRFPIAVYQPVGFRVRQGSQQDRIYYAEDGRVGANPQRQSHDSYECEDRVLHQHPQAKA